MKNDDRIVFTSKEFMLNDTADTSIGNKYESENSNDEEIDVAQKNDQSKKLIKFLLINIGMVFVLILYTIGGAFLFQLLEQQREIQNCQTAEGLTNTMISNYTTEIFNYILFNTTDDPWSTGLNSTSDPPHVYKRNLTRMLQEIRDYVVSYNIKYKYYGQDCEKQSLWVFASSFLFALSVVTSIGYGHITPLTWEGQIVCICYATIGIPVFLMAIANISGILSDMFRYGYMFFIDFFAYLYKQLTCKDCSSSSKKTETKTETDNEHLDVIHIKNSHRNLLENIDKNEDKQNDEDNEDDSNEEDEDLNKRVNVPLIIILIVFATYLYLGAFIFANLESWTLIQSSYFAYISLGSIGFGDFVSGIPQILSGKYSEGSRNLIITSVYIVFGMSILAMCFDLMQDQMIDKIKKILHSIGVSSKNDDEDDGNKLSQKVKDENQVKFKKDSNKDDIILTSAGVDNDKLKLDESFENKIDMNDTMVMNENPKQIANVLAPLEIERNDTFSSTDENKNEESKRERKVSVRPSPVASAHNLNKNDEASDNMEPNNIVKESTEIQISKALGPLGFQSEC